MSSASPEKSWPPIDALTVSGTTDVSPPKDWESGNSSSRISRVISSALRIDEVAHGISKCERTQLDFWPVDPKEATYYELYDRAAGRLSA